MSVSGVRLPLAILMVCCATSNVYAQTVSARMTEGPYYTGFPVTFQLEVDGFQLQPEPKCSVEATPDAVRVVYLGASSDVSSSIQIGVNGRTIRSSRVRFRLSYQFTATKPGTYSIGPFRVTQNGNDITHKAVTLTFGEVEDDPDMRITVTVPETAVYPGQKVPVKIQWWYAADPRTVQQLAISCPLFDQFRFVDQQMTRRDTALPLQTTEGRIEIPAQRSQRTTDGREWLVLSATRTFIPERPGTFEFEPATAVMQKVTSWRRRRDLFAEVFGDRRMTVGSVKPVRATGEPLEVTVKPFPSEGRPESFAGGIGRGFSLNVAADRTVVRVGDPITLRISLRGDGNLENLSLPPLSADGGLDTSKFRLPDHEVPGVLRDGVKVFEPRVRVTDAAVSEIPALAYSWFNPDSEAYETVRSAPIALRVDKAIRVGGDAVYTAASDGRGQDDREPPANLEKDSGAPADAAGSPRFTLSGADLSVVSDPSLAMREASDGAGHKLARFCLYAGGALAVFLAAVDRRRRNQDPRLLARRRELKRLRSSLDTAAGKTVTQAAEEIAAALRGIVARVPDCSRDEVDAIVAECDALIYAPSGTSGTISEDSELLQRARAVADKILKEAE